MCYAPKKNSEKCAALRCQCVSDLRFVPFAPLADNKLTMFPHHKWNLKNRIKLCICANTGISKTKEKKRIDYMSARVHRKQNIKIVFYINKNKNRDREMEIEGERERKCKRNKCIDMTRRRMKNKKEA